jgi:RimJ/RimL family protein N-acetyltransferase
VNAKVSWSPGSLPDRVVLQGSYCRLEPLAEHHADSLFEASMADGASQRFQYLATPPQTRAEFQKWLQDSIESQDPLFFAVVCQSTGRCEGRQGLMRSKPKHGVIELGHVLWGPRLSQTRSATEAFFLHARYVFETLGFRRFEWKCDAANVPSRRAAERFGFAYEGTFRQHMIVKGINRDTVWFSMLDSEWPSRKQAFEKWLAPENFGADGRQKQRLVEFRV